jgi:transposase
MKYALRLAALIIFLSSCNSYKTKYPYSLSDFKPELRKDLEKVVANGGMCINEASDFNSFTKEISASDLQKLLNCEHPLLRAFAFNILCKKEGFNIDKILVDRLDDTAIITFCMGEWGEEQEPVADYFIDASKDHTSIPKSTLFETVIAKHPYLIHSASFFLRELSVDQKYYPYLKKIIENKYPWHYRIEEDLIQELSRYKRNEDTALIAKALDKRWFKKEEHKFELIENNPSPAYFFAIERYSNRLVSFNTQKLLQEEFWRDGNSEQTFEKFIYATAAYKSERAAVILGNILKNRLYKLPLPGDNIYYPYFEHTLSEAVKKYDCIYYKPLSLLVKDAAEKFDKRYSLPPMEATIDTTIFKEKKTW